MHQGENIKIKFITKDPNRGTILELLVRKLLCVGGGEEGWGIKPVQYSSFRTEISSLRYMKSHCSDLFLEVCSEPWLSSVCIYRLLLWHRLLCTAVHFAFCFAFMCILKSCDVKLEINDFNVCRSFAKFVFLFCLYS